MDRQHEPVHNWVEPELHEITGKRERRPADGERREYHRCWVCEHHICFYWSNRAADEKDFLYYEANKN